MKATIWTRMKRVLAEPGTLQIIAGVACIVLAIALIWLWFAIKG